jgi:hypothetical protein
MKQKYSTMDRAGFIIYLVEESFWLRKGNINESLK